MNKEQIPIEPDEEVAFHFIVRYLRENQRGSVSSYGYDLYLPHVVCHFLSTVHKMDSPHGTKQWRAVSPVFLNAAWELARRGVLRPGVSSFQSQATDDGSGGSGFSVTTAGRRWLAESGQYEFVPIEPSRFAKQLASFTPRFGTGFEERSQEAIRCYGALAYVACTAMCGAAAESILLALAIQKKGDQAAVEKDYFGAGGRGRIEKLVLSNQKAPVQEEVRGYLSLLKYWRDSAAHGHRTGIGDNEAYTALAVLLRFVQFASDRWSELTTP